MPTRTCWGEWRRAIREAVSALYERYGALLLGAAVRIVHSQAEAEDVLHNLFVSLPVRARH